tara:strand:- start:400 stop:546 length:147 start_codon:yes stop_codon:yes gene_type:complete
LKIPNPNDPPWPDYPNPTPPSDNAIMELIYRLLKKIDDLEERIKKLEG